MGPLDFAGVEIDAAEVCAACAAGVSSVEAVEVAVLVDAGGPVVLHGIDAFPDFLESAGGNLERDSSDSVGGGEEDGVVDVEGGGGDRGFAVSGAEAVFVEYLASLCFEGDESVAGVEDGGAFFVNGFDDGGGVGGGVA